MKTQVENIFCPYCRRDNCFKQCMDESEFIKEHWEPDQETTDWLASEYNNWRRDRISTFMPKEKLKEKYNTLWISNQIEFFPFYVNFPYSYNNQNIITTIRDLEYDNGSINQTFYNYRIYNNLTRPILEEFKKIFNKEW